MGQNMTSGLRRNRMKKYKVIFEVADNFDMKDVKAEKVVLAKIKNNEKHWELEITKCELQEETE